MQIKDKIAVVSGGASGLGESTCKLLVEKGAKVAVFDIAEDKAQNLLNELGAYEEAIYCYDRALQINIKHEDAWNNRGNSLHYLKRYDEAIFCYCEALKIDPNYEAARKNIARILTIQNKK